MADTVTYGYWTAEPPLGSWGQNGTGWNGSAPGLTTEAPGAGAAPHAGPGYVFRCVQLSSFQGGSAL